MNAPINANTAYCRALESAQEMANRIGNTVRIYRAYGAYGVRPAASNYNGAHIGYVIPKSRTDQAAA